MNKLITRTFASSAPINYKVAIVGAAGGIGQPLSLLMKLNKDVSHLALYDIVNTPGVAADLSHINTAAKVTGHKGPEQLADCLTGCDVIIVPAGVPRKPGMTRDDLFNTNASIVMNVAKAAAKHAPKAHMLIISNPVNSTVPIVSEVYKKMGVYDPKRIFGVTSLDVVRAATFVGQVKNMDPKDVNVHVAGGHSGPTILPLLSQTGISFTDEQIAALTKRIQYGGDEVVKAKDGTGSATLSMAEAGAHFARSLLSALKGAKNVIEPTYVLSDIAKKDGIDYFATNVELGKNGVEKIHPIGKLSAFEQDLYKAAVPELQKNIQKGVEFVAKNY